MNIINDIFNILSEKLPIPFLKGDFTMFGYAISRLLVLTVALLLLLFIAAIVVFCIMMKKSKKPMPEPIAPRKAPAKEDSILSDKSHTTTYTQTELYKAAITTDYEDVVVGDEQLEIEGDMDMDQIIITDINENARAAIVDEFDFDIDTDTLSDFGSTSHEPLTEQTVAQQKTAIPDTLPLEEDELILDECEMKELYVVEEISSPDTLPLEEDELILDECEVEELYSSPDTQPLKEDELILDSECDINELNMLNEVAAASAAIREAKPLIKESIAPHTTSLPKPKKIVEKHRYERSFTAKLIQAEHENKAMYSLIKNLFMNYNSVRNTISWNYESFIYGRNLIARLYLVGKTLRLFLALDPNAYDVNIYHQESKENTAKYRSVPMMVKITSKLALKRAVSLVFDLAKKNSLTKKTVRKNIDYINKYAFQSDEILLKNGHIRVEDPHKYKLSDSLNSENTREKLVEESKHNGKYSFENKEGKVYFCLYANNNELLLRSPNGYTTIQGAKRGIATFKKAVKEGNFTLSNDDRGYKFVLKAQSARFSYKGELQITKAHAELAIKKVSLFADIAVILDKN